MLIAAVTPFASLIKTTTHPGTRQNGSTHRYPVSLSGAEGGARTRTPSRARDFKSLASASFATSAKRKWRRHPDSNWRIEVLQTSALPLGYGATHRNWSGKRDSNPQPSPWQGDALAVELFPHITPRGVSKRAGGNSRTRTYDLSDVNRMLYQLSYAPASGAWVLL